MIQLQFRDKFGQETTISFEDDGHVTSIVNKDGNNTGSITQYSKDSPIAGMYQRMLHHSRKVGENLFQVIGAW